MHEEAKKQLKIKVCGMKRTGNIEDLLKLEPDYMGYIFYPKSARYIGHEIPGNITLPPGTKLVGVFVNASMQSIIRTATQFALDVIQLHGLESPGLCREVRSMGFLTIKAFGVSDAFDWTMLEDYQNAVDMFLFDTKTSSHGGSGQKFDWSLLRKYQLETPYLISGGIGPEDVDTLRDYQDHRLIGLDINSKFEISPGEKDIALLHTTFNKIRN